MADVKSEKIPLDNTKKPKEETVSEKASGKEAKTCSMLIQSPKISSQFSSPFTKRVCPDSSQTERFRTKRAKYDIKNKDDEDNQSHEHESNEKKEIKELESILKKKEETLRKLKLVKMYRAKNNLNDLEELIEKWRSTCQQAAQDLYEKFNHENTLTMGQFLDGLRVKHGLIRYSDDEEIFY